MALSVSDHALLRFLERGLGIDVEGIREGLLEAATPAHDAVASIGGGDHLIRIDGLVLLVRDSTLITVVSRCSRAGEAALLGRRQRR